MNKAKKPEELEKEVKKALGYAESIIDTVREPLIALDGDLRVVSASRSFYQVFKVEPEETEGEFIYDLGNRQWDIPKLRQLLEEILPENATFNNFEVEHEFPEIGKRIMLLNARRIPPPPKQPERILLAIEDVTERKKMKKVEMEAEFVSIVSHQLRAPLTTIMWLAEILGEEENDNLSNKQREYFSNINKSAKKMSDLIDNLLNLSRIEAGTIKIELKPSHLEELIQSIIDEAPLTKEKQCKIIFDKPKEKLPTILLDESLFSQVVRNLLDNAIHFSKPGKCEVQIKLEKKDKYCLLTVADKGIGIPQKAQKKIFEKFFRADNAVRVATKGIGLGLYVTKIIVGFCKGKIWFESEENKGATFYVSIPFKGMRPQEGRTVLAETERFKV